MASYTQDGQPLAIETPLGKDKLLLEAFTGEEALGELFVHFGWNACRSTNRSATRASSASR
jgi:hypothetical protein